jgi:hypothetical protein
MRHTTHLLLIQTLNTLIIGQIGYLVLLQYQKPDACGIIEGVVAPGRDEVPRSSAGTQPSLVGGGIYA